MKIDVMVVIEGMNKRSAN